ncbi:HAMP domain-containing sensor histidine kinase [Thiomicrorhabdus sp.]|uniref:HAMP domain-containing sensor histidine kinase n=1 Tax=Thiomicrorhabdus sp. TaxID=2039724 RepID=UPI002AA6D61B|nr:HAMP domain-containing sensor histidine kinase [Thiomicrorhabdus sp.]
MIDEISVSVAKWLWLALVIIGVSLFFTAYYFRRQSKRLNRALSALYELNHACEQDALDFFNQAWSILSTVGCIGLKANIEWFGERKTVDKGSADGRLFNKQSYLVHRDDMRFEIIFYITREANQLESLTGLVLKTFINILEQDLVLKQAEILTSQKRLERYQLFVQHEIKNIAQFIQLLSEQVQVIQDDNQKIKLVERLVSTLPVMAQRARKTIDHMKQPLSEFYEGNVYTLKDLINDVVEMYGLQANIEGNVSTKLPRQVLLEVLKNILGNFRDHPTSNLPIQISITQDAFEQKIKLTINSHKINDEEFLSERMFEPFWTTSESGMGLGLFLSRELLKQLGGAIYFYQNETKEFGFTVELPGLVD